MFTIIQYVIDYTNDDTCDVSRMIESEFKNDADKEYALAFFKEHSKLPDLKESYYA